MSLKYLSVDEMEGITASWVDPSHADRRLLSRMPSVGGLLPLVDEAHRELLTVDSQAGGAKPTDMNAQMLAVDLQHDSYVRVAWYALEAHIQLRIAKKQDPSDLVALRNGLLPMGLDLVDYSYREESSQAKDLETRLSPENKAVLASIPIKDGTLLDAVHAWIKAGKTLGKLQTERDLQRARPKNDQAVERARNKWIRAVKTVQMVLKLDSDEPGVKVILEKIDRVVQKAEARMRNGHVEYED